MTVRSWLRAKRLVFVPPRSSSLEERGRGLRPSKYLEIVIDLFSCLKSAVEDDAVEFAFQNDCSCCCCCFDVVVIVPKGKNGEEPIEIMEERVYDSEIEKEIDRPWVEQEK